ncbi:hypothetical protein [Mesoflavibacter profundi]|uniref:hypothetical protein n=1 Tax=Mesoflavibacter profundi TaxID=2708110 RepID=UPI0035113FA0
MSDVKHKIWSGFQTEIDVDGTVIDNPEPVSFRLLTQSGAYITTESGIYLNKENNG